MGVWCVKSWSKAVGTNGDDGLFPARHKAQSVITIFIPLLWYELGTFGECARTPSPALELPISDVHLANDEQDNAEEGYDKDGNYGHEASPRDVLG